ncbi:MAG TPA: hypothetical protein GXZ74_06420 [Tissierellia bacterium]|nr:hypothetical protein [Tissierellia bacterium]
MSSQNRSYRVEQARPAHDEGFQKLLAESSFDGAIRVSFGRRPSVIESFQTEATESLIYGLIDPCHDEVVGMGVVTIRPIWLKGQLKQLAYLSGLRITPDHQRAFFKIPQMYEAMYQSTKDRVDLYLTTIVSSNTSVIRMFEKKRRSMPEYRLVGEIETFFLGPKTSRRAFDCGPLDLREHDGAVYESDWLSALGADFCQLGHTAGYTIAPGWKQYDILGYQGIYRLMPYLPTSLLHWPRFPRAGHSANYLAGAVYGEDRLEDMIELLRHRARGYDFLMLSALSGSRLSQYCRRLTPAIYRSRLYQVLFHDQPAIDLSQLQLDVVFL